MLTEYIRAAIQKATFKTYSDGTIYGELPGLQGVWANAETREACEKELQEVLEDWIAIRLWEHLSLPTIDGLQISIQDEVAAEGEELAQGA